MTVNPTPLSCTRTEPSTPLISLLTNAPVSSAPMMPPMPCTPKASNESSYPNACFNDVAAMKHNTPATTPMITAGVGPTKPDAGVMATRPATAPDAMPRTLGLPLLTHSANIQPSAAAAVANCVTSIAMPARPSAAPAEPALNPNQPTHSREAPINVYVKLCGGIASLP